MYARIYREGSDAAHFSVGAALQGFDIEGIKGPLNGFDGIRIRFVDGQPERAAAVLGLACIAYAAFLERSQIVVPHGVAPEVQRLVEAYTAGFVGSFGGRSERLRPMRRPLRDSPPATSE
jgi:hypothetical protein